MDNRIKITHIIDTLCIGGRENVVINLCNGLNKEKYDIYLVILSNDNNPLIEKVAKHINVIVLPFSEKDIIGIHSFLFLLKGIPFLKRIFQEINPSIIHTHSALHRLWFISLAIKQSSIKCKNFHTVHTIGTFYTIKSWYDKFQMYIERKVMNLRKPYIIAVSKEVEGRCKALLTNCCQDIQLIQNGVDLRKFYKNNNHSARKLWGFDEKDIIIIYVSRFSEGKSHLTLLKAITILSKRIDNVKLCLVGDGELAKFERICKPKFFAKACSFSR